MFYSLTKFPESEETWIHNSMTGSVLSTVPCSTLSRYRAVEGLPWWLRW